VGVAQNAGWLVVVAATCSNLLIAVMFIARVERPDLAPVFGWAGTAMALPLALASVYRFGADASAWDVVLPLVFVVFAIVEVLVDAVLGFDVRRTALLGPYLGLFYLAQWALIGAAFRVDPRGGAMVLVTYFVCLAATFFSLRRVGHGPRGTRAPTLR
jgi:formate hydrogenlyase subunit 3/multisubunit Na+/H+ antiporter MnhD subunit